MALHVATPARVLHAGFHKTGSTFLQRKIFPQLTETLYLGAPALKDPKSLEGVSRYRVLLLSSEAGCGYPYPFAKPFSSATLLANVRLFSISKVFIIRRELHGWAFSLYFQTLNEGLWWSPEEFIRQNREALLTWKEAPEQIDHELEREGVEFKCFNYEDLKQDPQASVDRMCDFLGVGSVRSPIETVNPGYYGGRTIWAYRNLNRIASVPGLRSASRVAALSSRNIFQRRRGSVVRWLEASSQTRADQVFLRTL